jgi:hypothetical protein
MVFPFGGGFSSILGGIFSTAAIAGTTFGMLKDFAGAPIVSTIRPLAFKGNTTEMQNLMTILAVNGWSTATVFSEMMPKLDSGTAVYPYSAASTAGSVAPPAITSKSYVCYHCVGRIWDDLVFQYRLSIPEDKIPATIKARPKCW